MPNELGTIWPIAQVCNKWLVPRANLPDRTADFFAAYTQSPMRDRSVTKDIGIRLEGHRFDDIRRWGWLSIL